MSSHNKLMQYGNSSKDKPASAKSSGSSKKDSKKDSSKVQAKSKRL